MALVDVPTLAGWLAQADPPTVIDVRWKLGGPPGREGYLAGHIPGATFLDLDAEVTAAGASQRAPASEERTLAAGTGNSAGAPGAGGRHPLPEPGALQASLRVAGVQGQQKVVVYDFGDGMAAARLWWTLRWAGHPDVCVLDGGVAAWEGAGQPLESGAVSVEPGDVTVRPGGMPVLDADGAADVARRGVLLDARAPVRYRGEHEPIDPVAGHIPGAVNVPYTELVDATGRLLPPERLRALLPPGPVVGAYCGSGVTAAHTVLALEAAGLAAASLYVGSWSDWICDPSRPVAAGEEPG